MIYYVEDHRWGAIEKTVEKIIYIRLSEGS